MKDCAHVNTNVKNAQLLGGTFPSGSLPRLGGRNPIADLSLNSQASSINSADTSKRPRKRAQRLAESGASGRSRLLIRKKNRVPESGFSLYGHCAVFTGKKTTARLKITPAAQSAGL